MVEKFYYDILEQHLKQAETIKPYREELEKNTKTFNELLFDVAFDRPFKIFNEATPTADPAAEADPIIQGLEAGTQPTETPAEPTGVHDETDIAALQKEAKKFTELAAFTYFVNSMMKKFREHNMEVRPILNEWNKEHKQINKVFLNDFEKDLQATDDEPITKDQIFDLSPRDVSKRSLKTKIFVIMAQRSKLFREMLQQTDNPERLMETVKKAVDREATTIIKSKTGNMPSIMSHNPDDVRNAMLTQLETQNLDPDQLKKLLKLGDDLEITGFSKRFGSGGDADLSMPYGDLTASDVIDVLQQNGKLDDIMNGAFKTFSTKASSIAEALNVAANKVFKGQIIGENPALQKTNEERTLMDVVNDHVFYGDVSKKKLVNTKFWNEAPLDATDNPTAAATQQGMSVASPTKTTAPGAPQTGPQNEPKIADKDLPQKPIPQQTKPDVNALSTAKNNALRQSVALVTLTTIMTFMASFADHFGRLVASEKKPEVEKLAETPVTEDFLFFNEGIIDTLAKGVGGVFKSIGGFLHNMMSVVPVDLNELASQEKFNQVAKTLLKQAKSGDLSSVLSQFNVAKQSTMNFKSEIFNPKVLNKYGSHINEAIAKAKADTERALNQFNETSLQKIMQNAYLANAPKGVKAAYKVAGAIDKFKTKMQGV